MNESTRRILIEYAIVAIIGLVFYLSFPIGSIISDGLSAGMLIYCIIYSVIGSIFVVGWYHCFIVDYLGFTSFSFRSILQVFGRLLTAISRSLQNDSFWWFLFKLVLFGLFGWAIGLVRAIIRIKKSMDE